MIYHISISGGLGNRILGIECAYYFAKYLNEKLIILWENNYGCQCNLNELFNFSNVNIEIKQFDFNKHNKKHNNIYIYNKHKYINNICKNETFFDINNVTNQKIFEIIKKNNTKSIFIGNVRMNLYDNCFIKNIQINNNIIKTVKDFIQKNKIDKLKTYAIHFRGTDVEKYSDKILQKYKKIINSLIYTKKYTNFFVCSDCETFENKIKEYFNDIVIINNKNSKIIKRNNNFDWTQQVLTKKNSIENLYINVGSNVIRNEEHVKDAFIDAIILSRCNDIFSNYNNSTFINLAHNLKNYTF